MTARHLTGSPARFYTGYWNLSFHSSSVHFFPAALPLFSMSEGAEVVSGKKNTFDDKQEGGRRWKTGVGSQREQHRNRPLTQRGHLENLSEVSICEEGWVNIYGEGRDLEKKRAAWPVPCIRGTDQRKQVGELPVGSSNVSISIQRMNTKMNKTVPITRAS